MAVPNVAFLFHRGGPPTSARRFQWNTVPNPRNLIDWTSRFRPQPFDGKHGLLMSASPSMVGGNRGLWVEFLGEEPASEADRVDAVTS